MDILQLNPEFLEQIAGLIDNYCVAQESVMSDYFKGVNAETCEWTDTQSIQPLLDEVYSVYREMQTLLDEIRTTYPPYFIEKAVQIRNRPGV